MKTAVQYLSDNEGKTKAIQVPITQWTRIVNKLNKYEQMLKIKSDLAQALNEVKKMRRGQIKKQSLQDFLNEL